METARLGDWVLRASRGFTQRANSVVTAGSPGIPVPAALDAVERWYAARDLPANLTLAGPVGFDPADDAGRRRGAAPGLPRAGPHPHPHRPHPTHCGSPTAQRARRAPPRWVIRKTVEVGGELTDEWFTAYRAYREVDDEAARAILTGSPAQVFATVRDDDGTVVGIGRLGPGGGLGRHRGDVGRPGGAAAGHRDRGCWPRSPAPPTGPAPRPCTCRPTPTTPAALALYERHGFERHHAYVNLRRPPA